MNHNMRPIGQEFHLRQRRYDAYVLPDRTQIEKPTPEEIAARFAEIPPDTRGTTAAIFGDPLPGRSALDQRRASEGTIQ